MRVRVKFFASLREAAGQREVELDCLEGARVEDALRQLRARFPRLAGLDAALVSVNLEYVGPDFGLHDGDELGIIPPVSGGGEGRSHHREG